MPIDSINVRLLGHCHRPNFLRWVLSFAAFYFLYCLSLLSEVHSSAPKNHSLWHVNTDVFIHFSWFLLIGCYARHKLRWQAHRIINSEYMLSMLWNDSFRMCDGKNWLLLYRQGIPISRNLNILINIIFLHNFSLKWLLWTMQKPSFSTEPRIRIINQHLPDMCGCRYLSRLLFSNSWCRRWTWLVLLRNITDE